MAASTMNCDVVIIGAGLSGLQAAQELRKHFKDVVVVEASNHVGGRVKQVDGLAPWPVELGPEFVHGREHSALFKLIEQAGWSVREYEWPDKYYYADKGEMFGEEREDADVDKVHELFASVAELELPEGGDQSALEWLKGQGVSDRVLALAEVCYANDFGSSLNKLGMKELQVEARAWVYGETYIVLNQSLRDVVGRLAAGTRVVTGWAAAEVECGASGVLVRSARGPAIRARAAVITVPLTILQAGTIAFSPPLPVPKQRAIEQLEMSNAIKVILGFSERFWPEELFDVVCTGSFLPEVWMLEYPPGAAPAAPTTPNVPGSGRARFVITGFVAGEAAEAMSRLSHQQVVARSLEQLDRMFASPSSASASAATPATSAFVAAHIADWSKEPYIRGAYSYPTVGAAGARAALAAPVAGRLFFAGEATHPGVNPCMQAALDTGATAAAQVVAHLQPARSRL